MNHYDSMRNQTIDEKQENIRLKNKIKNLEAQLLEKDDQLSMAKEQIWFLENIQKQKIKDLRDNPNSNNMSVELNQRNSEAKDRYANSKGKEDRYDDASKEKDRDHQPMLTAHFFSHR